MPRTNYRYISSFFYICMILALSLSLFLCRVFFKFMVCILVGHRCVEGVCFEEMW